MIITSKYNVYEILITMCLFSIILVPKYNHVQIIELLVSTPGIPTLSGRPGFGEVKRPVYYSLSHTSHQLSIHILYET